MTGPTNGAKAAEEAAELMEDTAVIDEPLTAEDTSSWLAWNRLGTGRTYRAYIALLAERDALAAEMVERA